MNSKGEASGRRGHGKGCVGRKAGRTYGREARVGKEGEGWECGSKLGREALVSKEVAYWDKTCKFGREERAGRAQVGIEGGCLDRGVWDG